MESSKPSLTLLTAHQAAAAAHSVALLHLTAPASHKREGRDSREEKGKRERNFVEAFAPVNNILKTKLQM